MGSLNKASIIGNLGGDPDIRVLQNGDPVANLTVATTEKWKGKDGEKHEKTEWHRVTLYSPLSKVAQDYLNKGSQVYIEGRLETRKWTDKAGVDRYTTEIIGQKLVMLGKPSGQSFKPPTPKNESAVDSGFGDMDDDIPF